MSVVALTGAALLAFAANSLFARLALAGGGMDAAGYTGVRLLSGGLALAWLLRGRAPRDWPGSWRAALALFVYALAFSVAYVRLGVAVGALVLFATVQAGMLGWALLRGQAPSGRALLGMGVAMAGLVALLGPGLSRPDPGAAALMVVSGLAWAAYTLLGRGGADPVGQTAGNFVRTVPAAVPLVVVFAGGAEWRGLLLAVASGALASGFGYVLWYRALPALTVAQASVVQLAVPVLAALGGVALLHEPLTLRLVLAGGVILVGVGVAVLPGRGVR